MLYSSISWTHCLGRWECISLDMSNLCVKHLQGKKKIRSQTSAFQTWSGIWWIALFARTVPGFWPVKTAFSSSAFENKNENFYNELKLSQDADLETYFCISRCQTEGNCHCPCKETEETDWDYLGRVLCSTNMKEQDTFIVHYKRGETHPFTAGNCSQISECCQLVCSKFICILSQKYALLCGTRQAAHGANSSKQQKGHVSMGRWEQKLIHIIPAQLLWIFSHSTMVLNHTCLSNLGS